MMIDFHTTKSMTKRTSLFDDCFSFLVSYAFTHSISSSCTFTLHRSWWIKQESKKKEKDDSSSFPCHQHLLKKKPTIESIVLLSNHLGHVNLISFLDHVATSWVPLSLPSGVCCVSFSLCVFVHSVMLHTFFTCIHTDTQAHAYRRAEDRYIARL
jgi:hypothetical protein